MTYLKSASYWVSIGSITALYWLSSRLDGMTFVLISVICFSYCIGRGLAQFGKGGHTSEWKSSEFTVLISSLVVILALGYDMENLSYPVASAITCKASYNIGRGLAEHYVSKISTVFNR